MKAQVSVEFVAYLSFTLFVSAILIGVLQNKQVSVTETKQEQKAQEIIMETSYIAEYALTQSNTSFNVTIPLEISEDYNVTIESGLTVVEAENYLLQNTNNYEGRTIVLNSGGQYEVVNNGSVYFDKQ